MVGCPAAQSIVPGNEILFGLAVIKISYVGGWKRPECLICVQMELGASGHTVEPGGHAALCVGLPLRLSQRGYHGD